MSSSTIHSQQVSRREMLQVGGLGLMGVTLPQLLQADEHATAKGLKASADA